MDFSSVGKQIKARRLQKSWNQEQLAEKAGITAVYVGMIERGEKVPKLETFIKLINVREISGDVVLADVTKVGYQVRMSQYMQRIESLSDERKREIYSVLDVMLASGK